MKRLVAALMLVFISAGGVASAGQSETPNPTENERWRVGRVQTKGQSVRFAVFKDGVWQGKMKITFQDGGSFPSNQIVTLSVPSS
jgi:hypothetical protein